MHIRRLTRIPLLFAAAVSIAPLTAQSRVLVVDSQSRPGTDFTDLPAAEAAAQDGDILQVRDGTYTGFTTSKALVVLGDQGAQIDRVTGQLFGAGIVVRGLPAGRRFVVDGMHVQSANFAVRTGVHVDNCQGDVVVQNVEVTGPQSFGFATALDIDRSRRVSVAESDFSFARVMVDQSTLLMTDTEVRGYDAFNGHGTIPGSPAITATGSDLVLSRNVLRGGDSVVGWFPVPPQPGIRSNLSVIQLVGDNTTVVQAGTGSADPVAAIAGTGALTVHPDVRLLPHGGAPPTDPLIVTNHRRVPSMRALGAPPGGLVRVDLYSDAGDSVFLFAGVLGDRIVLPPLGDVWLDIAAGPVMVTSGVQGPDRHFSFQFPAPDSSALLGLAFAWQGVAANSQSVFISNPAFYVHD